MNLGEYSGVECQHARLLRTAWGDRSMTTGERRPYQPHVGVATDLCSPKFIFHDERPTAPARLISGFSTSVGFCQRNLGWLLTRIYK